MEEGSIDAPRMTRLPREAKGKPMNNNATRWMSGL